MDFVTPALPKTFPERAQFDRDCEQLREDIIDVMHRVHSAYRRAWNKYADPGVIALIERFQQQVCFHSESHLKSLDNAIDRLDGKTDKRDSLSWCKRLLGNVQALHEFSADETRAAEMAVWRVDLPDDEGDERFTARLRVKGDVGEVHKIVHAARCGMRFEVTEDLGGACEVLLVLHGDDESQARSKLEAALPSAQIVEIEEGQGIELED
jgi:hypothetical protein